MNKRFYIFILASIMFAGIGSLAIADSVSSANGMFFFGPHAGPHNASGSSLTNSLDESSSYTDATEANNLSQNAKIGIGIGAGVLIAGGIAAAIIAASGNSGGNSDGAETLADPNITIQADTNPADQHFQYQAFDIVNNSTQAYTINNLSVTPITAGAGAYNELKLCSIDANADCPADFASTCAPNEPVQPGKSCKVWLRAVDGNAPLGTQTEKLTIGVQNAVVPTFSKQQAFTINYSRDLYAGGYFLENGFLHGLYKWNGSSWNQFGVNVNNEVKAIIIYKGDLIVAGELFDNGSGISRWNGHFWSQLGSGVDATVNALTIYDGSLIVGGNFGQAGGESAQKIAAWNGASWSPLGAGMKGGAGVYGLTVDSNGDLIAGGQFTTAGTESVSNVAGWDGSWHDISGGLYGGTSPKVYVLANYGGELIAGGRFQSSASGTANNLAAWNGSDWREFAGGAKDIVSVLDVRDNNLIAGGNFLQIGSSNVDANKIAEWNGSVWSSLGNGLTGGFGTIKVSSIVNYDGALIAGGNFTKAGEVTVDHIAMWDWGARQWSARPSVNIPHLHYDGVTSLKVFPSIQSVQTQ